LRGDTCRLGCGDIEPVKKLPVLEDRIEICRPAMAAVKCRGAPLYVGST